MNKKEQLCQSIVLEWIKLNGLIKIIWWLVLKQESLVKIWKNNSVSLVSVVGINQILFNSHHLEVGSVPELQEWKKINMEISMILLLVSKLLLLLGHSNEIKNHQESVQALIFMNSFLVIKEISVLLLKLLLN